MCGAEVGVKVGQDALVSHVERLTLQLGILCRPLTILEAIKISDRVSVLVSCFSTSTPFFVTSMYVCTYTFYDKMIICFTDLLSERIFLYAHKHAQAPDFEPF